MSRFEVSGMTCSACSAHVEKAVRKLDCVKDVQVSLLSNSMNVTTVDGASHADEIVKAVRDAGYDAGIKGVITQNAKKTAPEDGLKSRFIRSLALMMPLMYISMQHMLGYPIIWFLDFHKYPMVNALAQLVLAVPVLYINRAYFTVGFKRLWQRQPNMDSLIAVGSGASFVYGMAILFGMAFSYGNGDGETAHKLAMSLYFESSVMILTLITLGKFFESRAKKKTTAEIEKLVALAPDEVTLIENGEERRIKTEDVKVGDILQIRPGERVPVDGVLLEGAVSLDQSHITGESIHVDKSAGDELISGSISPTSALRMRATKVGEDTTLSRIISLVREAGDSKAPISKLADKVSGVFVPIVMGISLLTFILWLVSGSSFSFALSCAIAVLVISCPCALGLATPVAIMVGTGVGARNGILFRNGEVLETLHHVRSIVLDKTGTLTEGRMTVQLAVPTPGTDEADFLQTAASLENGSEHPLARAVLEYCAQKGISPAETTCFEAIAGRGLSAELGSVKCLAGNRHMMEENGINLSECVNLDIANGLTMMYIAREKQLLGCFGVADELKASSHQAIDELKSLGITPYLLTGDRKPAALSVANSLGIDEVIYEVMPGDKAEKVKELQVQGQKVAMVGDGINDAPALKQADIGIAVGSGTDIAIETSDVVLASNVLTDIASAVRLSRSVIKNIKENLFWAFFYNIIGIPIAAGVLYPAFGITLSPMIGAAAMSLSSVFVVSNALRLRRFHSREPRNEQSTIPTERIKEEKEIMEKTMHIEGMSCNHCKMSVEKALSAISGVSAVEVSLEKRTAVIHGESLNDKALSDAVTEAGFEVKGIE